MIAKVLDPLTTTDRRRQAGHDAESQLAFYLKRTFGHDSQLRVINGLQLEVQDDAAQIDHLVIHPYGMIVIESKSVYGEVKLNAQGEWSRSYRGRYQGMPSAKLQADRQVLFLQRYLAAHEQQLLDKRTRFAGIPIDVLVAVSDDAVIHRPKNLDLSYLVKAEQVPERVTWLVAERQPKRGFFALARDGFRFNESELAGVTSFLCNRHTPLTLDNAPETRAEPVTPTAQARQVAPPIPAPQMHDYHCKHCQGTSLEVRWGHSYYFKCLDCTKNTPISRTCASCHAKERIRKEGSRFFSECTPCGHSALFFATPSRG